VEKLPKLLKVFTGSFFKKYQLFQFFGEKTFQPCHNILRIAENIAIPE